MSLFSSFLDSLQKKVATQNAYKTVIIDGVQEIVHISLDPEAILSLTDGVLRLSISPTLKSALILKQEKLLIFWNERGVYVSVIQ